jgi:NAD(P)-dependent dehydrogenase (short-subunit alcohol dehydrogenase family)
VLAIEWGPDGIRVNAVVPGPIAQTEGTARLAPTAEAMEMVRRTVPIARLGTPGDLASACLLLASRWPEVVVPLLAPIGGRRRNIRRPAARAIVARARRGEAIS